MGAVPLLQPHTSVQTLRAQTQAFFGVKDSPVTCIFEASAQSSLILAKRRSF